MSCSGREKSLFSCSTSYVKTVLTEKKTTFFSNWCGWIPFGKANKLIRVAFVFEEIKLNYLILDQVLSPIFYQFNTFGQSNQKRYCCRFSTGILINLRWSKRDRTLQLWAKEGPRTYAFLASVTTTGKQSTGKYVW